MLVVYTSAYRDTLPHLVKFCPFREKVTWQGFSSITRILHFASISIRPKWICRFFDATWGLKWAIKMAVPNVQVIWLGPVGKSGVETRTNASVRNLGALKNSNWMSFLPHFKNQTLVVHSTAKQYILSFSALLIIEMILWICSILPCFFQNPDWYFELCFHPHHHI